MTVINTNTAATITANALTKNERAMSQTMERLSTGQRINSAADDAAGLAISSTHDFPNQRVKHGGSEMHQ